VSTGRDEVLLLECNLDDMTGEELGYALERLLEAGALDAWFTPIYMKKNRPAVILSVLCAEDKGAPLRQMLLRETSTLGVRWHRLERDIAPRRTKTVETRWGPVRCKLKILEERVCNAKPEYDDCARLAREHGIPLRQVLLDARQAAEALIGGPESKTGREEDEPPPPDSMP